MKTDRERKNAAIVVIRWSARVLGLIMAGFLLLMFIGQSLESNSNPLSEPIEPIASIVFGSITTLGVGSGPEGIYITFGFLLAVLPRRRFKSLQKQNFPSVADLDTKGERKCKN